MACFPCYVLSGVNWIISVISHCSILQRSFSVFRVTLRFFRSASSVPVLTPYSLIKVYWDMFFRFKVSHSGSNVIIPTPALHLAYPKMRVLNNAEYSAIIVQKRKG